MARSTALQEQMVELSGQGGKGEGKGRKRECTCMLGIKDPTVPFKAHPLHSGPPYKLSYFPTTPPLVISLQYMSLWEIPDPSISKEQGNPPW